jgi:hypothetical protein
MLQQLAASFSELKPSLAMCAALPGTMAMMTAALPETNNSAANKAAELRGNK